MKKFKNINIISYSISPTLGGIESMAYYIGKYLTGKYNVRYYCGPKYEGVDSKLLNMTNDDCSNSLIKFSFQLYKLLSKSLNKEKTLNICMTYQCALACFFIKKIYKIPYIILIHGNEIYNTGKSSNYFARKMKILGRNIIFKHSEAVFANSNYTKRICEKFYKNKNLFVVNPGIEYCDVKEKLNPVNYNIFSLGRLVKRKGFQNVLYSLPNVLKVYPNLKYHIAGDGPYKEELKRIIKKLGIEQSVILYGHVDQETKRSLYENCDLFVMPSFEIKEEGSVEGFGIVYIEANSYGRFVIASNTGGVSDAVIDGKTGYLIRENNVEDIEKSILKFYDTYTISYCKEAVEWAKKHDYSNTVNKYIDLLI